MQRILLRTCGRHPSDVREDVLFIDKVLPVRSLMSAEYSGVILSTEPWTDIMVCHSLNILYPLFELLEIAIFVKELRCNVVLHAVGTEG